MQIDMAFEDEGDVLPWLSGLQQLMCFFAPTRPPEHLIWTLSKLRIQKLRLKVVAEAEETGRTTVSSLPSVVTLLSCLHCSDDSGAYNEHLQQVYSCGMLCAGAGVD